MLIQSLSVEQSCRLPEQSPCDTNLPVKGAPANRYFDVRTELGKAMALDPGLSEVTERVGYPEDRRSPASFATLAGIINAQQLSYHAARAIWEKLMNRCQGSMTAERFMALSEQELRSCGLSRSKVRYIRELAGAIRSGEFDPASLVEVPDDKVVSRITGIRGLGCWSAEIFALNALGRPDVFPARDLALQVAIQHYGAMDHRPNEAETRAFCTRWQPHRSAVALLMWKYYRSLRD